jgi:hypothetical protein
MRFARIVFTAAGVGGFFVALVAGAAMFLAGGEDARSGMWAHETPQAFLGFDNNEYPGDAAMAELRRTFAFAGYWLNPPPGAKQNTWAGKRETMLKNGFGFLVLFAMEAKGESVITADDIRQHLGSTPVSFFVYNDACPPSPGCVYRATPPVPSASGVAYADVWQFAQSPRRRNFTRACSATYHADGNCYPPHEEGAGFILIDLDSARSSDPSSGGMAH